MDSFSPAFCCRFCGQVHAPAVIGRAQRALCIRCGTTLARPAALGRDAGLAFATTGVFLFVPALVLPFATVSRVGAPRSLMLLDGARALWQHGMPWLASWVAFCGTLVPAVLLVALIGSCWAKTRPNPGLIARGATTLAHALDAWSMPEVHVLAVLVAFVRIEQIAEVQLGAGFWCYTAMALMIVLAGRSLDLDPPADSHRRIRGSD
jgi:paraquat-inducible protein A